VFHVELRRFPHVARAFNLPEDQLRVRIVLPWVRGLPVELDDRSFTPDRTRLTIYEGPQVAAEERGLGRGWSTVTRVGEDATRRVLDAARRLLPNSSELKRKLLAASQPVALGDAVSLAGDLGRPSERLGVAEQAVWELLHEGHLSLVSSGTEVTGQDWERILLRWQSWADPAVQLVVANPPEQPQPRRPG
jgi:hypothetical protein